MKNEDSEFEIYEKELNLKNNIQNINYKYNNDNEEDFKAFTYDLERYYN